jgi:hypothetical protein
VRVVSLKVFQIRFFLDKLFYTWVVVVEEVTSMKTMKQLILGRLILLLSVRVDKIAEFPSPTWHFP